MRWSWPLVPYLIVFAAGVLVGSQLDSGVYGYPHAKAEEEARGADAAAKSSPSRRLVAELSGAGDELAGPFELLEGPAVLMIEYSGQRALHVKLVNERGNADNPRDNPGGILGGQFGPWKARAVAQLESNGRYFVEVLADGDWKVIVAQ